VERIARSKRARKPRNKADVKRDIAKRTIIKLIRDDLMPITAACKGAMIAPNTYYAWLEKDPKFAARVEAARSECMRKLIDLAKKQRGGPMKLLAAMFREEFGERAKLEVETTEPIKIVFNVGSDRQSPPEAGGGMEASEAA